MIYVGIDVAKTTHYAAAADSDGVVLIEPFAFDNDASGFTKLISKIAYFPKEQLIIGLDPTVCQSGKFKARYAKMSKRGYEMLRFALINSACQLTLRNYTFSNYYHLKLSQGLSHYGALGHVAHKLVRVIFSLLKHNTLFDAYRLVKS